MSYLKNPATLHNPAYLERSKNFVQTSGQIGTLTPAYTGKSVK